MFSEWFDVVDIEKQKRTEMYSNSFKQSFANRYMYYSQSNKDQ